MKLGVFLYLVLFLTKAHALYGPGIQSSPEKFVVSLHLADPQHPEYNYFCNGVLVSPTRVLTAGHCIDQLGAGVYDMSLALTYRPELVRVKVNGRMIRASGITFAPSYFESNGLEGEDLAMIDLAKPVSDVIPPRIAGRELIRGPRPVTLIAREKKVTGALLTAGRYSSTTVLFLDSRSGACLGDSGGAILVEQNGQQLLAGILMYSGDENCEKKAGYGHFPKVKF